MELTGYDLRYLITSLVLDHGGTTTTSEVRKRRLHPMGDGRYTIDELPRSTRDRIRRHARNIEASILAGEPWAPRRPWPHRSDATLVASPFRDANWPPTATSPNPLLDASRKGEATTDTGDRSGGSAPI
ncbi:MAG: hypothetical protein AAGC53_01640 [Actinomycetota bacterium]